MSIAEKVQDDAARGVEETAKVAHIPGYQATEASGSGVIPPHGACPHVKGAGTGHFTNGRKRCEKHSVERRRQAIAKRSFVVAEDSRDQRRLRKIQCQMMGLRVKKPVHCREELAEVARKMAANMGTTVDARREPVKQQLTEHDKYCRRWGLP